MTSMCSTAGCGGEHDRSRPHPFVGCTPFWLRRCTRPRTRGGSSARRPDRPAHRGSAPRSPTPPWPTRSRRSSTRRTRLTPSWRLCSPTGALTGARRGELCALRWSDFDEKAAVLTIARSVFDQPGRGWGEKDTKSHQARRVVLDDVAVRVHARHRERVHRRAKDAGVAVRPDGFIFSFSPAGCEPIGDDVHHSRGTHARDQDHTQGPSPFFGYRAGYGWRRRPCGRWTSTPRRPQLDLAGLQPSA